MAKNTDRQNWTNDRIRIGFDQFLKENGRLPTAPEIDSIEYLPSARHIQRSFGGLRHLRKELGYEDLDFGKGEYRSAIAKDVGQRGKIAESYVENELVKLFGEVFVHVQRKITQTGNRVDLFVYAKNRNFAVDVFACKTTRDLQKNINIKIPKYKKFVLDCDLFFVLVDWHESISDILLNSAIENMSGVNNFNILRVMTHRQFFAFVRKNYEKLIEPENLRDLGTYNNARKT